MVIIPSRNEVMSRNYAYIPHLLLLYNLTVIMNGQSLSCSMIPQLRGHEASSLELLFAPSGHTMSCELLVFINDDHDQTEECFLVRILYD